MKLKKWLKRIALGIFSLIIILLLAGFIYEQVGRYNAEKLFADETGQYASVGGDQIYYEKKGSGDLTIVFLSGAGGDHKSWDDLSDTLSHYATTVAYDRRGIAWSDRGTVAINSNSVSEDLANLLNAIDAPKPYIMVGHSAGGMYLWSFINSHQNDVKGAVLIDPAHPKFGLDMPENIKEVDEIPSMPPRWLVSVVNGIGIVRLLSGDPLAPFSLQKGGAYEEYDYLINQAASEELLPSGSWNIPLQVITAGDHELGEVSDTIKAGYEEYWQGLQLDISRLSTQGTMIIAKESGHMMLEPEKDLITKEILQMVQLEDSINVEP